MTPYDDPQQRPPGPWSDAYAFPATPPTPGPWASGYAYPPESTPPRDPAQTPLGSPPPAAQPRPGPPAAQAAPQMGPPQGAPPPGQSGPPEPDYGAIVRTYLDRLTRPMPLPRPRPLTGGQALAVEMNPGRRNELLSTFQGPHREEMEEFKYETGRQGQAAGLAARMEQAAATERYRQAVQANTAAYKQKQQDLGERRTVAEEKRTDAYVKKSQQPTGKGAPKTRAQYLDDIDKQLQQTDRDIVSGQSRASSMSMTSGKPGQIPQALQEPLGDAQERRKYLTALRQTIGKMSDQAALDFQSRPKDFQDRVIERLTGYKPPSTSVPPLVGPGPDEEDEGAD